MEKMLTAKQCRFETYPEIRPSSAFNSRYGNPCNQNLGINSSLNVAHNSQYHNINNNGRGSGPLGPVNGLHTLQSTCTPGYHHGNIPPMNSCNNNSMSLNESSCNGGMSQNVNQLCSGSSDNLGSNEISSVNSDNKHAYNNHHQHQMISHGLMNRRSNNPHQHEIHSNNNNNNNNNKVTLNHPSCLSNVTSHHRETPSYNNSFHPNQLRHNNNEESRFFESEFDDHPHSSFKSEVNFS